MNEITIPNQWSPRSYQLPFFKAMAGAIRRACLVYHRRAGKDSMSLNFTAAKMLERKGIYWHCLPKIAQARKAIWNGIDGQGRKIIDQAFPKEIRKRTNEQEMLIELKNGSIWQLVGSDNYDAMVGSNPIGIVFSEYSISNPQAWDYFRPMLAENKGWAVFIYTARGKNHGHLLYKMAKSNKDWFCELLTVDNTKRDDGTPVIGPEIIQQERDEGMSEEKIQQEYYCSFDAQIAGAVYGNEIRKAYDDNRIRPIPIDPSLPLNTAWDLGHRDATSIWFWQCVFGEVRLVGYYESNFKKLSHYIQEVKKFAQRTETSYELGRHLGPHDCNVMRLGQAETVQSQCGAAGLPMTRTERPLTKQAGIEAVRKLFYKLYIDDERADTGLSCLTDYQYEYDEKKKCYKDNPLHDWASNGADALQTLALGWNDSMSKGTPTTARPVQAKVQFSVY